MDTELITENFSILFAIPSLLTFIVILALTGFKKWRSLLWGNKLIAGLIFSLFVLNFLEVITFFNIFTNYEILLRAYYVVSIASFSLFFCLCFQLNNPKLIFKRINYFIFTFLNISMIYCIAFSNLMITGATRTSYSISRVPGEYYWVIQFFIVFCLIFGPLLIWRSIINANNPLDKKRHLVILCAFIPIIVTDLVVIILMQFDVKINISFILPLSTLIFLVVYLFTENKSDLFRVLVNIPFSQERDAYKEMSDRVIEYLSKTQTEEKISLKEAMAAIEKSFINRALEIKDGNHNLAAEMLSISMSTIYRKEEKSD